MHVTRPLISLFAAACLAACTAGTARPARATAASAGGSSPAGAAGTSGSAGAAARAATAARRASAASISTRHRRRRRPTCGLQNFDLKRKPAEILLVLDRSKSMIEDTVADGVTKKWDAVAARRSRRSSWTPTRSVSWGLKVFPEGEDSACVAASVTNNVVVPMAPMNAAAVVAAHQRPRRPAGNGTPTGDGDERGGRPT